MGYIWAIFASLSPFAAILGSNTNGPRMYYYARPNGAHHPIRHALRPAWPNTQRTRLLRQSHVLLLAQVEAVASDLLPAQVEGGGGGG